MARLSEHSALDGKDLTLASRAYNTILKKLLNNELVPGQLVNRRTLANEFRGIRRRRRLHDTLRDAPSDADPSPEVLVVRREQDEQVLRALARLRPRDREALQLALWEGLSHAAIAELLGCSTPAVTQRIYRATRQVCKEYQRLERSHSVAKVSRQLKGGESP